MVKAMKDTGEKKTRVQKWHSGSILTGVGLLLYVAGSALKLPDGLVDAVLFVSTAVSLVTLLSLLLSPRAQRRADSTMSFLWGQFAMTALLVLCTVGTVRLLLGA